MTISIQEFKELGKKPKYKILFEFLKKNKDKAYSKKDLLKSICKEINMTEGQLNVTLYTWNKTGVLENKRPYYAITEKGLKSNGKIKYEKK